MNKCIDLLDELSHLIYAFESEIKYGLMDDRLYSLRANEIRMVANQLSTTAQGLHDNELKGMADKLCKAANYLCSLR